MYDSINAKDKVVSAGICYSASITTLIEQMFVFMTLPTGLCSR